MNKLLKEIMIDLRFLKSHTLQTKWYKILKVFILLGFLAGYYFLFGLIKTIIFFAVFVLLMTTVHFIYRKKTNKFKQNWLDFIVQENSENKPIRIGKYYYSAIVINIIIAISISQTTL